MTKEAKLQAAMRILPEWVGYDEEIKALQQKVENANRQTERDSGKSPVGYFLKSIRPWETLTLLILYFRYRRRRL